MNRSLPALLRRCIGEAADAEAIRHVDGRSLTYAELGKAAARLAKQLLAVGVNPGEHVAVYLSDKIDSASTWIGVAWSQATEVPINPQLKVGPLTHMLTDSQARFLITSSDRVADILAVADQAEQLDMILVIDDGLHRGSKGGSRKVDVVPMSVIEVDTPDHSELRDPDMWAPACIVYTSGTTGMPKGVLIPWAQLSYQLESPLIVPIDRSGPRYSYTAPYHLSGKGALYLAMFYAELFVVRETFSLSSFWSDVREHGCTYVHLFPHLMTLLLRQPETPEDADNPVEVVDCLPATPAIDEFKRRFGIKRLATGYGMTEIGGPIVQPDASSATWNAAGRVASGPPGYEARLVDENDFEVARGEVGELIIRAAEPWALNSGYYRQPAATAAAWRNGWFHTGDAMLQDSDGNYYFVDRMKDCIRHKGENVSSFEVEKYVNEHRAVAESAAIGVSSDLGEQEIKIVVVLKDGTSLEPTELYRYLEGIMPKYMLPRYIDYVGELAKTPATGRIRKGELKKRFECIRSWDRDKESRAPQRE